MKYRQTTLAIIAMLSASIVVAEDFKTINGKEYKDATVKRIEPDGVVIQTKSGISKIYYTELPKEVQQRFNYDPDKGAAFSAEQMPHMSKTESRKKKRCGKKRRTV